MYKKIEWDCFKIISDDRFDKNMMFLGYKKKDLFRDGEDKSKKELEILSEPVKIEIEN